jgi:hypothetical protein
MHDERKRIVGKSFIVKTKLKIVGSYKFRASSSNCIKQRNEYKVKNLENIREETKTLCKCYPHLVPKGGYVEPFVKLIKVREFVHWESFYLLQHV